MVDMVELKKLSDKHINKLTDEELTEALIKLNTIEQKKLGTMSVYYSISGCLNIMDDIYENNIFKEIKSEDERQLLEVYYENILKYLENIDERVKSNGNELEELKDLRYKLERLMIDIEPYIIETSCLEEKFDYYLAKRLLKEQYGEFDIDEDEIDSFIHQAMAYLMEGDKEYEIFEERISAIIGYLPFRMTKEKFFEIVKNTLKRNLSTYSKSFVDYEIRNYKKIFDGSMEPSFGTKYDDYFRKVQELKRHNNLKGLTVEELGLYSENSKVLLKEIENLGFFIRNMGIVVNKLISVFLISSSDNNFNLDKNTLNLWKEYLIEPKAEYEELAKALSNQTTKLENEMFEANEFLEKLIMELVNRKDLIDEKLNEELMFTNKVLTYYNDFSFISEEILFYDEEESIVDVDYLDEVLNNFIQFLNRSIRAMSNDERKLRMRRLLSSLEFPFERPEDFIGYLESSLDLRITSSEEIIIGIESIDYMMNMENSES